MATKRQKLGEQGEALACQTLIAKGYQIHTRNWHCQQGELDIVAKNGAIWVFVEVKTRRTETTDAAFASITPTKRERLIAAAYAFLETNDLDDVAWRIDAIAVALNKSGSAKIEHVEDALGW